MARMKPLGDKKKNKKSRSVPIPSWLMNSGLTDDWRRSKYDLGNKLSDEKSESSVA